MNVRRIIQRFLASILILAFLVSDVRVYAQGVLQLPAPGTRLTLSKTFEPALLKGIKVHRNDPFRFDFILDKGDDSTGVETQNFASLQQESTRLIKYFLAALTIPDKDLWVNLSPYEKDRIVPEAFGQTEMGRDLLAQDYMLKQITASVIYPFDKVGKEFWDKVYAEALKRYGTTDVPVDTFNKVWIIPEKATVYINNDAAFVVDSRLKVMLESDYLAIENNQMPTRGHSAPLQDNQRGSVSPSTLPSELALNTKATQGADRMPNDHEAQNLAKDILREVVIPVLEREVNEGKSFATLRQVYHSLILATWYKRKLKNSILGQAYTDKKKISGIGYALPTWGHVAPFVNVSPSTQPSKLAMDMKATQVSSVIQMNLGPAQIWSQYVEAFKKGAYDLIKDEVEANTQQMIPRKYFSGGAGLYKIQGVYREVSEAGLLPAVDHAMVVTVNAQPIDNSLLSSGLVEYPEKQERIAAIKKAYEDEYERLEELWEFPGVRGVPNFTESGYFTPTDIEVAARLLEASGLRKGMVFVDAGGGDGRVALVANRVFDAQAVSIEENEALVKLGERMAAQLGLANGLELIQGWIKDYDFSKADVVYYTYNEAYDIESHDEEVVLGSESNFKQFEKKIIQELRPGAVVMLTFGPDDLKFDPRYFEEFTSTLAPASTSLHPRFYRRKADAAMDAKVVSKSPMDIGRLLQEELRELDPQRAKGIVGLVDVSDAVGQPVSITTVSEPPLYERNKGTPGAYESKKLKRVFRELLINAYDALTTRSDSIKVQISASGSDISILLENKGTIDFTSLRQRLFSAGKAWRLYRDTKTGALAVSRPGPIRVYLEDRSTYGRTEFERIGEDPEEIDQAINGFVRKFGENELLFVRGLSTKNSLINDSYDEEEMVSGAGIGIWEARTTIRDLFGGDLVVDVTQPGIFRVLIKVRRDGQVNAANNNTGGIDLNPSKIDVLEIGGGEETKFNTDPALVQRLENASGLTPVIVSVHPLGSLQQFLATKKF